MGLLDRIGKIASAAGGALQTPFGFVKDLAVGAFTDDDEFDGFVGTLYGSFAKRGGELLNEAFGPEGVVGAGIGALPGAVRAPARAAIHPVLEGIETVGREVIREPLTAAVTAASLMQAGEGFDLGEGYRIAQNRSLGQAIALAVLTENITDEAEVAAAQGSDWYESISGTMDAAARLFLDVDVITGKAAAGFRRTTVTGQAAGKVVKAGRTGQLVGKAMGMEVPREGLVTLKPGLLEEAGAALYRAAPERLQRYGGKAIRSGADVTAALADPRLRLVNDQIDMLKAEEGIGVTVPGPDVEPAAVSAVDLGTRAEEVTDVPALMRQWVVSAAESTQIRAIGDELLAGRAPSTPFDQQVDSVLDSIAAAAPRSKPLYRGMNASERTQEFVARATPGAEIDLGLSSASPNEFIASRYATSSNLGAGAIEGVEPVVLELRNTRAAGPGELAGGVEKLDPESAALGLKGRYGNIDNVEALTYGKFRVVGEGVTESGERKIILEQIDVSRTKGGGGATTPPGVGAAKDPAAVDRVAARIRDLMFHDHRHGAIISRMLAESDDYETTWGALMGHKGSMEKLWAERADVAGLLSRLQGDQAQLAMARRMEGIFGADQLPDELRAIERSQLDAEIDRLYDTESRLLYHEEAMRQVRSMPAISGLSEKRAALTRSQFYQGQWGGKGGKMLAAPLRMAINMRPRNFVDLHDAAGDVQVTRLLRKSGLDVEEQDALRGSYMAAADPSARARALEQIEARVIRATAEKHGITDAAEIEKYLNAAAEGRQGAANYVTTKSRRYDGKGRSVIEETDDQGVTHRVYVPLAVTQEFNHFILPNLDDIDHVLKRGGEKISRFGAAGKGAVELMEQYQRLWKPSVLLRVGWPIRVVGEEQIRLMSQIGALLTAGRTATAAGRYVKDIGVDKLNDLTRAVRRVPKEGTYRAQRAGMTPEMARATRSIRFGTMHIRGLEIESSLGTQATFQDLTQQLNSARGGLEPVVKTADQLREGYRRELLPEWQSLEPTTPGYGEAWTHAVNNQIGKDAVWRMVLEGRSRDEILDFLRTSDGRAYMKRVQHWRHKTDEWLDIMEDTANDYLPTPELKALALEGKASIADLEKAIPDAAGRPLVNGAIVMDVKGGTRFAMALGTLRDNMMKTLGTIPTDILSRQPYFDWHYTQEVNRIVNIAADQGVDLTPAFARQVETEARKYALGESKKLLYDLADESELSHMLRFVSPFYSAWQEVLTRWTGIAVDNPAFVARLHEVWRAPERMGIVTDENGATINEDGTATLRIGDKDETVEAGKDRYINFRLLASDNVTGKVLFNDLTRAVPGVKGLENAKFNKKSFNTILQGAPGVGPMVQIPVNEIVKGRPQLEESLKFVLPFGATQSTLDMVMPATARRMKTKAGGEDDRLYRNQLIRIYFDMQVDYNRGLRTEVPTYAEAKKKTDALYNVRTIASFVSPAAPSFQSPYQPYIDAYRALVRKDEGQDRNAPGYRSPDDIFLDTYGDDFFPLTQALSKTVDGVPPTLEGAAARQKYVDLIEKHPELGGLIVGAEGAGEFSSAVYQSQLQNKVRPGSPDFQRQAFAFEEAQAKPNERLGWIEFSKAMDIIDAERMNRGLPNLQVKQARDLADLKRNVIAGLARKYPEWHAKFQVTDRGAWDRKLTGLRDIAADDRLAGRAEIQGLREYLRAREIVVAELAARKRAGGASTIGAAGNHDLAGLWANITTKLTDGNPAFSSLFYRYLERDPLDIEEEEVA